MKKKIALMVYPNFSMQEIGNICSLFRWRYDSETVVFSSRLEAVNAEEGLLILPHKTYDEFSTEDYDCLILPGCSDFTESIKDPKIKEFLEQFKGNDDFVIGAICAGPIYLSQAGLLSNRKFTNSLFVEINEMFNFINEKNLVYAPLVEDKNIITAVGSAFNEFAVAVARKVGYDCPDNIFKGIPEGWKEDDYKVHLSKEDLEEIKNEFKEFICK
jgi:putative intracellular protease/amidase